jgi:hypothetical protein
MVIPRHEPTIPQPEELKARWSIDTYIRMHAWAVAMPGGAAETRMEPIEDEE